jgi:hypothetical protein
MSSPRASHTIRRSIAIPAALIEEAQNVAPAGPRTSFNRLVRIALEEFVARRREERFATEMERMAQDPDVQAELRTIEHEFAVADGDGL